MTDLQLETLDSAGIESLYSSLRGIYREAYDEAPYDYDDSDADEFVERLRTQSERDCFRLIIGHRGDEIAGFAYGFRFPPELWWRGAEQPPPQAVGEGTKFAVIELVVAPSARRNGFSRVLFDALLEGRSEDWGILLAKPGAIAHDMYERWGWNCVGQVRSYPHWPVDDAFVRRLN